MNLIYNPEYKPTSKVKHGQKTNTSIAPPKVLPEMEFSLYIPNLNLPTYRSEVDKVFNVPHSASAAPTTLLLGI